MCVCIYIYIERERYIHKYCWARPLLRLVMLSAMCSTCGSSHKYIRSYIITYIHIYIHTCIYTRIFVYIHICVYIHIHIIYIHIVYYRPLPAVQWQKLLSSS